MSSVPATPTKASRASSWSERISTLSGGGANGRDELVLRWPPAGSPPWPRSRTPSVPWARALASWPRTTVATSASLAGAEPARGQELLADPREGALLVDRGQIPRRRSATSRRVVLDPMSMQARRTVAVGRPSSAQLAALRASHDFPSRWEQLTRLPGSGDSCAPGRGIAAAGGSPRRDGRSTRAAAAGVDQRCRPRRPPGPTRGLTSAVRAPPSMIPRPG